MNRCSSFLAILRLGRRLSTLSEVIPHVAFSLELHSRVSSGGHLERNCPAGFLPLSIEILSKENGSAARSGRGLLRCPAPMDRLETRWLVNLNITLVLQSVMGPMRPHGRGKDQPWWSSKRENSVRRLMESLMELNTSGNASSQLRPVVAISFAILVVIFKFVLSIFPRDWGWDTKFML